MTITDIEKHKITNAELDLICMYTDGLSDMYMGYDPETQDYTLFAVEWDGMYGRHWEYFKTEAEREARLEAHSKRQLELLPIVRQELAEEAEAAKQAAIEKGKRIAAKRRFLKEQKTIGGHCPELANLLVQMRNDRTAC